MSPPANGLALSVQEGANIKNIDDLDNAETTKYELNEVNNIAVFDKDAVENEYPCWVKNESQYQYIACEERKDGEEYNESFTVCKVHEDYGAEEKHEFLADHYMPEDHCVIGCLCEGSDVNSKKEETLAGDRTTQKPGENKRKVQKCSGKSKRCNKKNSKIGVRSFIARMDNKLGKRVGGTTTKQSGNNGNKQGSEASASTETVIKHHNGSGGNGGGGGGNGGGGGDGDDPRKGKKLSAHNSSFPRGNKKKRKNKNSAGEEMEVDDSLSSKMEVDESSSPEDRQIGAEVHIEKPKRKPPERKLDNILSKVKSKTAFLMQRHTMLNHFSGCQKSGCSQCLPVNKFLEHYSEREKKGCVDCTICDIWQVIIDFHQGLCKLPYCAVCPSGIQKSVKIFSEEKPELKHYPYDVHTTLNLPTLAISLDPNEEVIFKDSCVSDSLTHFKEHHHYTFAEKDVVGQGSNGVVHDIVVHDDAKQTCGEFDHQKFVIKQAKKVDDDELEMYKVLSRYQHPNFVKTYLVACKPKDEYKYRIMMEKCDGSLHGYIRKLFNENKIMGAYEAMHFWSQVLDAVVHLHSLSIPIIHKDIKAKNVLLTRMTNFVRAKLADFDAVKLLHNEFTQPGLPPRGTPYFVAPEVAQRHVHGRPADIFSLGVFLLEIFSLLSCYIKSREDALEKLHAIDADICQMVRDCLQENPEDRPSAVQLREYIAVQRFSSVPVVDSA